MREPQMASELPVVQDASERAGLGARLFVGLQHVLPQHLLSRGIHRLARVRAKPVKNAVIGAFVRGFRPAMHEAVQPDPLRYASFNDFFTRELRPGARTIAAAPDALACPVDGTVSQVGELAGSRLIQAKGRHYALDALLGSVPPWGERFAGGSFATLYLAPYNYHRIHMPLAGTLRGAWYVPGRLFSVNATTAASVSGLFARNERVVCVFEDGPLAFAMVLVGALFVGSISTVWHGDVTPCSPRRLRHLPLDASRAPLRLEKGAEMGRFNMGSTVILVFPPRTIEWASALAPLERIEVGQSIARLLSGP
jgi:phosphatidylserine decarboxylase